LAFSEQPAKTDSSRKRVSTQVLRPALTEQILPYFFVFGVFLSLRRLEQTVMDIGRKNYYTTARQQDKKVRQCHFFVSPFAASRDTLMNIPYERG
jgi:hypothetical protein